MEETAEEEQEQIGQKKMSNQTSPRERRRIKSKAVKKVWKERWLVYEGGEWTRVCHNGDISKINRVL